MNNQLQDSISSSEDDQQPKSIRFLFSLAGTLFLGLGAIGVVIPILPTTPFLLLAVGCYYKGSKRMHHWILNNKWFGTYLRNYKEGKGISLKHKIFSILFLWLTISYSIFFILTVFFGQIILVGIAVVVSIHIIMLPTLMSVRSNGGKWIFVNSFRYFWEVSGVVGDCVHDAWSSLSWKKNLTKEAFGSKLIPLRSSSYESY